MFEHEILKIARSRLKASAEIEAIAGPDMAVARSFGRRQPIFPFMVHNVKSNYMNDPITKGFYYLDIYDSHFDPSRLDRLVHYAKISITDNTSLPAPGALRFYLRDVILDQEQEEIQKAMLMFAIRGADVEYIRDII